MALSLHTILALALTLCVVSQEGFGLPLSDRSEAPTRSSSPHVRTKRCSCNSWLDTECVYFCHLDIIWVNTPSKIIPYGLGSHLSRRRRRSAGRCGCARPDDKTCAGFCHDGSENGSAMVVSALEESDVQPDTSSNKLLTSFRNVVRTNMAAAGQSVSSRKKRSRADRRHIR